ncbi:MAG: helix-turn-helix domain-containing protein [Pseudonocardiaceae bacterium]
MENVSSHGMTLGQFLERARAVPGLSIRRLEAATGIPRSTIEHLLKDRIERPGAENLMKLARALAVNPADLFVLAGLPVPSAHPSVETVLRTDYDLPDEAVAEVMRYINVIVKKYQSRGPRDEIMEGETHG